MSLQIGKLTTDQRRDNTSVQFGQPESLWVTYRDMGERLPIVGEITQRQTHRQSPPQHRLELFCLGENCFTKWDKNRNQAWKQMSANYSSLTKPRLLYIFIAFEPMVLFLIFKKCSEKKTMRIIRS